MVLDVRKNLKPTQLIILDNFTFNNFSQKSSLGGVLALRLLLAVYGPGLAQMVLEVRKNPKPTQFYMLNIFDFNNFPKKSSPGGVLALGLHLAVYGPGHGPDGPGGPKKP